MQTETPTLLYTPEVFHLLGNISALLDVRWYLGRFHIIGLFFLFQIRPHFDKSGLWLGIPFNDTSNLRLQIAEVGEAVLGDKLLGLQVGNEPDLYSACFWPHRSFVYSKFIFSHGHRSSTYGPYDYYGDFAIMVNAVNADANIPTKNNLIAPSLAGVWTPEYAFLFNGTTTFSLSDYRM
jgi:hypothetical protein